MIRLMRGQVVVREIAPQVSATLWTPDPDAKSRSVKTHQGVVLGMGPPALLAQVAGAPEVPYDFEVGDIVQFHFTHNLEAFTREWSDGELATWIPQGNIDGVLE